MTYEQVLKALSGGITVREQPEDYRAIHNRHDKGYKYLLSSKTTFIQLLQTFTKLEWTENIKEEDILLVDKSFILQDFRDKEADLIYLVKQNKQPTLFYILMELQSVVDFQMPYRLLLYMVEIWRNILKDTEGNFAKTKDFKLPSIVPIVLYNGDNNWTAGKSFKEYQYYADTFIPYIVDFQYVLIDTNRYTEEELFEIANLVATVFLLDRKQKTDELIGRLRGLINIINKFDENEMHLFKNWLLKIVTRGIRKEDHQKVEQIITKNREVEGMISNLEETIRQGYQ
ncbi:MAG: Rpn family recombination-promoting nuclease/putative transposase, partial [Bacillota bacterium]